MGQRPGIGLVVCVSVALLGCQVSPEPPTVPESPMVQAQAVCEPGPPQVIEVPVPVPMPGQGQPDPEGRSAPATPQKGERVGRWSRDTPVNSVTTYRYAEGALYQAYVALGKATTILLAPGESFHQAIIGDKSVWTAEEVTFGEGEQARGGVWLSCNEVGKRSNLTITGSQHLYLLELHCTEHTFHAAISWSYRQMSAVQVLKSLRPVTPAQATATAPAPDAPSGTRYTWESNREIHWSPLHIYDTGTSGQQTIIVFPSTLATTDAPALYVRTPEGTQALVNYRVRRGYWIGDRIYPVETMPSSVGSAASLTYYLIDRISDRMELRVGEKTPTIVTITQQRQEGR